DTSREKRIGKAEIPIDTVFRFYRDSPRIEVTTSFTNTAKDHRLRICFDLPFNSETTLTATHFGYVERSGKAEIVPDEQDLEKTMTDYPEKPSGVQHQKGFIRVVGGTDAFTLLNRGLPEVELVDDHRIALTLLRCVGWLSRSDYPERPMHAGPGEETPGAQELNEEYEFNYAFVVHSADDSMTLSAEQSEVYHSQPTVIALDHATPPKGLFDPIAQIEEQAVRVSSLRMRGDTILLTLYNYENKPIETQVKLAEFIHSASEVKIDGSISREIPISDDSMKLTFTPREIKMCSLRI
ncbi:MAG: hypothetical protein ACFFEE_05570, partial [Candidatus Thorarchaeota archaeon]